MKAKTSVVLLSALWLSIWAGQAMAALDTSRVYAGGGLGFNDADGKGGSATGWQILGGYDLNIKLADFDTAVEVGFMSSGDFDNRPGSNSAEGLWVTWVPSIEIANQFSALGRIGLDLGDDNGIMIGFGGQYDINTTFFTRLEYVIRDNIDSLQINLLYQFQ